MERALKNLRAYFGISYALDITLDRLNAYVEKRQNDWVPNRPTEHIALASIKYELSILRRLFVSRNERTVPFARRFSPSRCIILAKAFLNDLSLRRSVAGCLKIYSRSLHSRI
jgi:hypothetical protein